ncbi:MAG TPA: phosphoribosylformylglycinamidine synthase subunit PurS, partial [Stellaceae bacterium]|nr:phosphoribosylformylglycinamidine synthase subunit PurS [Stellaceae bacterium]
MKARIHISLKSGVLDPQGKAIGNALKGLGFAGVDEV